jgi:hypothetical protein
MGYFAPVKLLLYYAELLVLLYQCLSLRFDSRNDVGDQPC